MVGRNLKKADRGEEIFISNLTVALWSISNLILLILIIGSFIFIVTAIWRIMKAQESLAESMRELISAVKESKHKNE